MAPFTWNLSVYELSCGEGLAVCVAHQGAHVFYDGYCSALPRGLSRQQRVALIREPDLAPVGRVEIEPHDLAAGIALALDALMERRRQQSRNEQQPAAGPPPSRATPPPDHNGPASVPVWRMNSDP